MITVSRPRAAREVFDQVSRQRCETTLAAQERARRSVDRYLGYARTVGLIA